MATIITDTYSDQDMQCPGGIGAWENGFKEARILSADVAERTLSDEVSGDWQGSTFRYSLSDYDRKLREQLASTTDRFWLNRPVSVRMTTRENRAVLGVPYTVFNGPIIDAQPNGMAMDITLGDIVSRALLSDESQIPWRQIKDGFLSQLLAISESLDREQPEAIIYGKFRRTPDISPASPEGFIYTPTLLGTIDVAGNAWWIWLVCGHAVARIIDAYVIDLTISPNPSSILADEGSKWLIPHHAGYLAQFGAHYEDRRSDTYGNMRRYTLVYGKVGEEDPDACAAGSKTLALAIDGVEPNADGTGEVITDRFQQEKHFFINYVANYGPESYQSGGWLFNPTYNILGSSIPIIDEASFDACSAIGVLRLPEVPGSPALEAGYIGSAIIGAHAGDRLSAARWIAEWNRSSGGRSGPNHFGQWRKVLLHPTQAIKDAAPLYEETNDILIESFGTKIGFDQQANRVPFVADFEHTTGRWMTNDKFDADTSITNYKRVIPAPLREYRFAPGITMAYNLARMEGLRLQYPPDTVRIETPIGPDANGASLGYLDLGDYITYRHPESVSASASSIRLAQIVKHQVLAGRRRVVVEAIDCDDLIDFDVPQSETAGSPAVTNDSCAEAIDIGDLSTPYDQTFDTTGNGTDLSVSGSPSFGGSGVAYHAAWFKMTGNIYDGVATFSTVDSGYDTQLAVFTGSCGALIQQGFNDNFGVLETSVLDVDIVGGNDYFILIAGYGPDDAGFLKFRAVFTPS